MCEHGLRGTLLARSIARTSSRPIDARRGGASKIAPFIVDFLCTSLRLVVEIDGDAYHATRVKADAARERKLVRAGYTLLRIPASLVERDLEGVVELARKAVGR